MKESTPNYCSIQYETLPMRFTMYIKQYESLHQSLFYTLPYLTLPCLALLSFNVFPLLLVTYYSFRIYSHSTPLHSIPLQIEQNILL